MSRQTRAVWTAIAAVAAAAVFLTPITATAAPRIESGPALVTQASGMAKTTTTTQVYTRSVGGAPDANGATIQATAMVTPAPLRGTVQFTAVNVDTGATEATSAPMRVSGGEAVWVVTLPDGYHRVWAAYSGSEDDSPSTGSDTFQTQHQVNPPTQRGQDCLFGSLCF
ncbi:Ig-like domain-containing protein [Rhodococcus sp. NPDC127528]|uniref:Ig-like domain-containing protein n=1 Tax=unclassified Rhodococcus (in: high G+C Gram-positive bacteria) TaxID=192944 RepID=UPI00363F9378